MPTIPFPLKQQIAQAMGLQQQDVHVITRAGVDGGHGKRGGFTGHSRADRYT